MSQERRSRERAHPLFHDIISLYGVYGARYVLPLVLVPYLARVLGVSGWGELAFAQGFSGYLVLIVEYGFNLSATREIARYRDSRERTAEIAAGVMGAKFVLAVGCVVISAIAQYTVPMFRHNPLLLWTATIAAIAQSFSLIWLFQGLERMTAVAALDVLAKAVTTAGVFLLVHHRGDGWVVLLLQATGSLVAVMLGLVLIRPHVPLRVPNARSISSSLVMGWTMFLYRSAVSLYTVGNAFILGLFVGPEFVGYYAGAEKISKAFVGLLEPIAQAIYPRISYLAQNARTKAASLFRTGFMLMLATGVMLSASAFVLSPWLVRILLGAGFGAAVPVLRIMALLPLLIGISNVFGVQWMLPMGMDAAFNTVIISAGTLNLILAVVLAPVYKHVGMAWAAVVAETFVPVAMYVWLRGKGVNPMQKSAVAAAEPSVLLSTPEL